MSYQNAYNEIMQQAIEAHAAGAQLDASAEIPGESPELLQELFNQNCRWIRGTARLIAVGLIQEDEGRDREKVLSPDRRADQSTGQSHRCRLDLSEAEGLEELSPEDPLAGVLPAETRLIDFRAIETPVYAKAAIGGRRIVGRLTYNRQLADVPIVLCRCSCGNYFLAREEAVLKGFAVYCGPSCRKRPGQQKKAPKPAALKAKKPKEQIAEEKRLRSVWGNMIRRCTSETDNDWETYGGRGIRVCKEWLESFAAFREWAVLSGYHQGLTLDRIDNDGDYTPQNCQWSTMKEQSNNRRGCIYVTYDGQRMTLKQAAEASGLPYQALRYRYHAHGEAGLFDPLQHTAARSGR
jgi:membrane-bound inhibitor of C-type lysozyme